MRRVGPLLLACILAAIAPWLSTPQAPTPEPDFPGWPTDRRPLPLTDREAAFATGFPGLIARFADGQSTSVIRWVTRPTRKLHPASHCYRGAGYSIRPLPLETDDAGHTWSSFSAIRTGEEMTVHERIYDNAGNSWPDVSAWYWSALLGKTTGPWWAVTTSVANPTR